MIETSDGQKPFLVVSNQQRNRNLTTVICVRITTSPNRPNIPSVVPIESRDGVVVGRVLCDTLSEVHKDKLVRRMSNAFTPGEMRRICDGLSAAVGCG